jgi:hypothetical protein
MADLETLDTKDSAIVPEVSVVAFDILTGKFLGEYTAFIDIDEQSREGRTVSASTLQFWLTQSDYARSIQVEGMNKSQSIAKVMLGLKKFMQDICATYSENLPEAPYIWGNGIKFDLGKLTSLYECRGYDVPWAFWAERDVRTLVDLMPEAKKEQEFIGVPHYGLDDCKHQIRYLTRIYQEILGTAQ